MLRTVQQFAVLIAVLLIGVLPSHGSSRVALVVGNGGYEHVVKLPNPGNDARDISAALKRLGFAVTTQFDLSGDALRRTLRNFSRAASRAEYAVVFYAGHGLEMNKQNYLVPVDAELKSDRDVKYEAVPLDLIMDAVDGASKLRLVLLDACRNNPFAASMQMTSASRSIGRGLARVEPSVGTLVSFAAKGGTTAADGDGRNSPYTAALLQHIEEPGLELNHLFRQVRDKVLASTNRRQVPFTYGSLPSSRIYLKAPKPVAQPKPDSSGIELAYWNAIKGSDSAEVIQSYLDKYPKGHFAFLARLRLKEIGAAAKKAKAEAERQQAALVAQQKAKAEEAARRKEAEERRKAARAEEVARRAQELADWQAVRTSTDAAQLKAYLAKYPGGTFADLAQARLEAVKRIKLAALPEATQPAQVESEPAKPAGPTGRELALKIQERLAALGCAPGRPDGAWGSRSRRALQAFARHGKVRLASLDPSPEALDALNRRKGRVCPLICGRGQVAKGSRCVAKTCPRGQELSNSGRCVKKRQARKTPAKAKRPEKKPVKAKTKAKTKSVSQSSSDGQQCGRCGNYRYPSIRRYVCGERYKRRKALNLCK